MKKPIKRKELDSSAIRAFVKETKEMTANIDGNKQRVYISVSNIKMNDGAAIIPSVSLPPVLTCANCAQCSKYCYALKMARLRKNINGTWMRNLAVYQADPDRYFREVAFAAKGYRNFRWHVAGDILSDAYLQGMVKVALECPSTSFLAFTKSFDIVNRYLDAGNSLPENLKIVFSGWVGLEMKNPHNLPTSHPIFADGTTSAPDGAKWCGGNCSECAAHSSGCWTMGKGDAVIFALH